MLLMLLCRLDSWLVDMKHHLSHNHIIFGSDLNHRPFGFAQGRYFCDRHGGNTYRRLEWREVGGRNARQRKHEAQFRIGKRDNPLPVNILCIIQTVVSQEEI
jgi:hypothetical protein